MAFTHENAGSNPARITQRNPSVRRSEMYTIKITTFKVGAAPSIRYVGTFADDDAAGAAAVKMMDSGLYSGRIDFDTVPITGVMTISADGYIADAYI